MISLTLPELYRKQSEIEVEIKWIDIDIERLQEQRKKPVHILKQINDNIAALKEKEKNG